MARFRNPRYAPDWLEPRLSPSGIFYSPSLATDSVSFDVGLPTPPEEPAPRDPNGDPIPTPAPLPTPGPELPD